VAKEAGALDGDCEIATMANITPATIETARNFFLFFIRLSFCLGIAFVRVQPRADKVPEGPQKGREQWSV